MTTKKHKQSTPEQPVTPESSTGSEPTLPVEKAENTATMQNQQEAITSLEQQLSESQAKVTEYLSGWQRALAEFSNYKKRQERDQAQTYLNTVGAVAKKYLEIVDDLDRALKTRPQDGEGAVWANGIELIYHKLNTILESEGVKKMETQGMFFDPNLHEAISLEDNQEYQSGQIIEVVKHGYLIGDRVLRPALVRVAK